MTDPVNIAAHETGKVRVFALDIPAESATDLKRTGAAGDALGGVQLNPAYVEIFPVSDLEQLGLVGYLMEGCGIPQEQIEPDRARLETLKGHVMLLFSRAFGGRAVTLRPAADIRLVATFDEPATDWTASPIDTASARPHEATTRSPRDARSRARRIGGGIFAVFMVLIALALYLVLT